MSALPEVSNRAAALDWYEHHGTDPQWVATESKARAAAMRAVANKRAMREAYETLYLRALLDVATEPNPGQGNPPGVNHRGDSRDPGPESVAVNLPANDLYRARLARWPMGWDTCERCGEIDHLKHATAHVHNDPKMRLRRLVDVMAREHGPVDDSVDLRYGNYQEALADLEDGSVDLVLTDPPYGDDAVALYREMAQWFTPKLKDGGSIVAYCGQATLGQVITAMTTKDLRYWWTLALTHSGQAQQLPGKWVMVRWKPLVWFVKGGRADKTYVDDVVAGSVPDKTAHEWAQGEAELYPIIESLTEPGALIVDPFAGSGTTGRAVLKMGRKFLGADR